MRVIELGACQARKFGAAVVGNVLGVSKTAMWWPHCKAPVQDQAAAPTHVPTLSTGDHSLYCI